MFLDCDRHRVGTVTLHEQICTNMKRMRKWIVDFHSKFQGRGIKITRINI